MTVSSAFLALPLELRQEIYSHILSPSSARVELGEDRVGYKYHLAFLRTSSQVRREALDVLHKVSKFIKLRIPLRLAPQYYGFPRLVPMVMSGRRARVFKGQYLDIDIIEETHSSSSPESSYDDPREGFKAVILLDDLPLFCRLWSWYGLTSPTLNVDLRLALQFHNPACPSTDAEGKPSPPLPETLQQRLLAPFGQVKNLKGVQIRGDRSESVENALRTTMAEPYASPEECLEQATRLKDEGNKAVQNGRYEEALDLFFESFAAMLVFVQGRFRDIWAPAFFAGVLQGGRYAGRRASEVRLMLRVRLVASIVLAYLKLERWEDARFWGMRSIKLMMETRAQMGEDNLFLDWEAADSIGQIYFGTAMAVKAIAHESSRELLETAAVYLPDDKSVKDELNLSRATGHVG